ncbi:MAG: hypothetical protein WD993_06535 [Thermoleophilaceae bacterium]
MRGGRMGDIATMDAGQAQHLRALEHANRVRLARAELKRRIASGNLAAAEVIVESPWEAESMSISDVLMSQRRWGRARCRRLLTSIGILENKRVGTLTDRQRAMVVAMLEGQPAPDDGLRRLERRHGDRSAHRERALSTV